MIKELELKKAINIILNYCTGNNCFINLKKDLNSILNNLNTKKEFYGTDEVIKNIENFSNYKVSSFGKILNKNNKELKPFTSNSGYQVITLCNKSLSKKFSIHRLIATAFLGYRSSDYVVNHIDGNKLNNHIDNLQWSTYSENLKHAYNSGLNISKKGEDHFSSKITNNQVNEIRQLLANGLKYGEIAIKYNISTTLVGSIKRKSRRKHD